MRKFVDIQADIKRDIVEFVPAIIIVHDILASHWLVPKCASHGTLSASPRASHSLLLEYRRDTLSNKIAGSDLGVALQQLRAKSLLSPDGYWGNYGSRYPSRHHHCGAPTSATSQADRHHAFTGVETYTLNNNSKYTLGCSDDQ